MSQKKGTKHEQMEKLDDGNEVKNLPHIGRTHKADETKHRMNDEFLVCPEVT